MCRAIRAYNQRTGHKVIEFINLKIFFNSFLKNFNIKKRFNIIFV